jgi:hypothetical protein
VRTVDWTGWNDCSEPQSRRSVRAISHSRHATISRGPCRRKPKCEPRAPEDNLEMINEWR